VQQARPVVEADAALLLAALPWPRHHLRLDTIGLAVPVWPGTRPYEVLPFQWSCLTETAHGQHQPSYAAFLADGPGDPRRAFALSLLETLGDHGTVLAYNAGFERNRLRELATAFEDLAPALQALQPRIFDVFQLLRQQAYHPAMAGSWSFRSVCRAWAPQQPVPVLDTARVFAQTWRGGDRQTLREALLSRGRREAAALQAIVQALAAACTPAPAALNRVHGNVPQH
jgi:Domain of unknown function(DUF2779)